MTVLVVEVVLVSPERIAVIRTVSGSVRKRVWRSAVNTYRLAFGTVSLTLRRVCADHAGPTEGKCESTDLVLVGGCALRLRGRGQFVAEGLADFPESLQFFFDPFGLFP